MHRLALSVSLFAAATAIAAPVSAAIIYTDVNPDVTVNQGFFAAFSPFNKPFYDFSGGNFFDGGSIGGTFQTFYVNYFPGKTLTNGSTANGYALARNLPSGSPIGATQFASGTSNYNVVLAYQNLAAGEWYNATGPITGYVGFTLPNADGNSVYAWAQLRVSPAGGGTLEVLSYAYESVPGAPINAGVSPEPATLAALSLGGMTLTRRRRATV